METSSQNFIPTIRSRLILLVLTCIIPAFLMVAALIAYDYHQERSQTDQASLATARAMMSAVDRELAGTRAALLALATSPLLTSNDLVGFYNQAKGVLETQSARNILLIDSNFQQQLNTLKPFGSELPSEAGHDAVTAVFQTGLPSTSDLLTGRVAKTPLIVVSVPVVRDGMVIYVLSATVRPERLAALLVQQRLASDRIASIFDSNGTIVARTHHMQRFVGKKGSPVLIARMMEVSEDTLENKTVDGIAVHTVFSRSAISNWTVAIGIPSQAAIGGLMKTLGWFLAATAALLLSSLAVAWWIGSRIAGSIGALLAPALALGSGKAVSVPALPLREADEVGQALTRASTMLIAARHKANHDPLTGLANRALFDDMLEHELLVCRRAQTHLAIAYIDLDGFKAVNDLHGHGTGDELLCQVAARLKATIRASDIAARLGGDEFALILAPSSRTAAQTVAAKLIECLAAPYQVGSLKLEISASIGIAGYPESGVTGKTLTHYADDAMYAAKAAGKRRYALAS
jgi:diguanylate cyclase (GGDEF)-like protein